MVGNEKPYIKKKEKEINYLLKVKKKFIIPSIKFIPIKIEERLMVCGPQNLTCPEPEHNNNS